MKKKNSVQKNGAYIALGPNPVNLFQARQYALESSPSPLAVIVELSENARDNASDVILIIDVAAVRKDHGKHYLTPNKITCIDNGTGLSHGEFLSRFCGAYSDSEHHHDVERAGRNGVGTKTYLSIADRVVVRTTTARLTEGVDEHFQAEISQAVSADVKVPQNGEPDNVWRAYEFRLHESFALPSEWQPAKFDEMGTIVEMSSFKEGTEIAYETIIERLSFNREWLQRSSHRLTIQVTGKTGDIAGQKKIVIESWRHPEKNWLTRAVGRSDQPLKIHDPKEGDVHTIAASSRLGGVLEFDFRVVGKGPGGQMETLARPALLLEICGALPYAPNLESNQSARTLPLLSFVGLANASSIGSFCNSLCGYARINSLGLKEALRNNKTTLATGPGAARVESLRVYLYEVLYRLHKAWYNETRSSQDEAAENTLREAEVEINLALQGANRNPFGGGEITRSASTTRQEPKALPVRHHRWECGACGNRWLAAADFTPKICAEVYSGSGFGDGCGSENIGLAKNQPRIGDCEIRTAPLGDNKIPAVFQFEEAGDNQIPVVEINELSPRYVELRESGSLSTQAQRRLKQYLVDAALVAIAEYKSRANGSDLSEELGQLYYNRMLRLPGGLKQYEFSLEKLHSGDGLQLQIEADETSPTKPDLITA